MRFGQFMPAITLTNDWDILRELNPAKKPAFDAIVANPPFSYRWEPTEAMGDDVRFKNHGLVLFSSVDNSSTTFSDAHLMKTYFNGAACTNLCPKNPPDNLPITYNIPLENVFIGNQYDIKKLKSKNYDYQFKQMCSQGSISCGSNARETLTLPLQADDNQYLVYPNPAGNQVTVAWDVMQTSALAIEIRNIHGAIVFNQQQPACEGRFTTTIDVTSLSPGTYILLIRSNDKVISKSFVKQ